jgi:hypothetical protein
MKLYDRTRGSTYITIRSRDLVNVNSSNSSGRFTLFESIDAGYDEVLGIRLASATIPNSWNNLSATNGNNKITFLEGATSYTITIPDGSYSIDELSDEIKSLMETSNSGAIEYTFSYSEVNNKLTISSNSATITTFKFSLTDSPRRFLGFSSGDITLSSSSSIVSDRAVDITDTQNSIYIRLPNLSNQKVIESSTGKYSNIIAHIPVVLSRNVFFTYEPSNPFEMELTQKTISSIEVAITYQDERDVVEFNKADWEINLEIAFHKQPAPKKRKVVIHKEIVDRYNLYRNRRMKDTKSFNELLQLTESKELPLIKEDHILVKM